MGSDATVDVVDGPVSTGGVGRSLSSCAESSPLPCSVVELSLLVEALKGFPFPCDEGRLLPPEFFGGERFGIFVKRCFGDVNGVNDQ